ncbi:MULTISPECIES: ABC transporter ATP-binding protein [Myxococcus]|uniref:ABC transporter ATP-binding protein n=1 Tax=Myxococcus llanfairpwllgwyngyllgogerychwyrndrobwllllantysiliogogogochensis TaxID=2590453 RepID=A0A540X9E6_9BACT|nr:MULTISPECIES: ABC transporter ATP-binding protein [Myxococcus]NTX03303.1 ABC transporter ATP-binding protein [Myxococcus sp. CA040A]TQF17819.1 ABC transporter ATP-binding protein [Myxococcus llanfairpwllgwyngyllgogerychwyrndrobwllllantysiliogogogochensis]
MSPLLEVKGLRRDYGALRAVDDVSFHLEPGSILGFIGPNGAGKSTTLRILATLDSPTAGEVLLGGHSLVDTPDRVRPLIGYMPDRYGTYDDVTVFEFLDFFARAYGLTGAKRRQRVESVMGFTGLGPLADKLTTALSKGMRQRVALGRTLLHDPQLLLLDEPADGLDPRARIELRELLRALADQGKAVIISSHILTELAEICDTCAIIEQGRLLATGRVEDILRQGASVAAVELMVRLAVGAEADAAWARAERLLLEQPRVARVSREGESLRVGLELEAGAGAGQVDAAAAGLLSALVTAGLPVCSFGMRERNLEDAFMTVTKGRLA